MSDHGQISLLELAAGALDAGDVDSSEILLRNAARRMPDDPEVAIHLGSVLCLLDSPDAAEQVRRAARLAEGDPSLLTWAAAQMFWIGDFRATHELIRDARGLMSEDCEQAGELAHVTGRLALEAGHDDLAEELLEAAFAHSPDILPHAWVLAEFHAVRGRLPRARDVVAIALEHSPGEDLLRALQDALNATDED